jgi:dihydrofolate synthase/folylpolyglutamate synthase
MVDETGRLYDWLAQTRRVGQRLGLETISLLFERLGNPQAGMPFIHVAGTNGKGSVCAMVESVLRAGGYHTGFFSSPHLVSVRERFRVDGRPIASMVMASLLREMIPVVEAMEKSTGYGPSYFEITTGLAALCFAREHCDVVLWETGLGGRLDATNAVTPLISVITNIAMDHSEYLGSTLTEIAAEKAGIIKPGIPVVSGETGPEASAVLRSRALANSAPFSGVETLGRVHAIGGDWSGQRLRVEGTVWGDFDFDCPLVGLHQRENFRVALGVLAQLKAMGWMIERSHLLQGLAAVTWPGRLHLFRREPLLVLDGAHNPAACRILAGTLDELPVSGGWTMIFGAMRDKATEAMLGDLVPYASRFLLVPVLGMSERSQVPSVLHAQLDGLGFSGEVLEFGGVEEALEFAETRTWPILVVGSLYLVGEALAALGWGERDPVGSPG